MLVVTETYQNYQNGDVSNQLADLEGKGEKFVGVESESVDMWHKVLRYSLHAV
jgi:hypothetical protein